MLRIEEAEHFGEGFECSESLIAGSGQIVTLGLEIIEEGEEDLWGDLLQSEGFDFDGVIVCGKDQKELEGIAVSFEGVLTDSFNVGQVVVKELMDGGGELHSLPFCHREKS
jgi:hypothetical protein